LIGAERELPLAVTICVVNYNGEQYLRQCLGSVFAGMEKLEEIILVDNGSEDTSLEIVRRDFPTVKVIQMGKNLGPAAARNAGFRTASCDRILFIDNDVSLAPECPDMLIEALNENPRAAAAMPRVFYEGNKKIIQYDGADSHFLGLMTLRNANGLADLATNDTEKIGSLITACFVVDRRKWSESETFDESFFFNYEDHDFGLRTRMMGNEILAVPSACAYHREGTKGLSLREGADYPRKRVIYLIRNRWQLIAKNYEFKTLVLLSPIFLAYEIFQFAGVIKKGWLREWFKAVLWIILHAVEILQKRRSVQSARRIRDREVLRDGPIPFTKELAKDPLERYAINVLDHLTTFYWKHVKGFL
jgi:GT2 family glycosyltransferase